MPDTVGVIGLGLMGINIARRLSTQGWRVVGFDVDEARLRDLDSLGGTAAPDVATVIRAAPIVLMSLPNGAVSRDICLGPDGIVAGAEGSRPIVIETTTARPAEAVDLAECLAEHDIRFLDVGLSGSGPMIAEGQGLGVVGGPDETVADASAVLHALCTHVTHVGGPGAGMTAKLVINLVLYINRLALAEGLLLAEHSGLEVGLMLDVLRGSAARSTAMDIWGDRMVDRRYDEPTSRIRQHVKDVQQILELADAAGLHLLALPQVALIAETAIARDLHDADNSVVIEVLRELSGAAAVRPGPAAN